MFSLGKRHKKFIRSNDNNTVIVLPLDHPNFIEGKDYKYLSLPLVDMPELATAYVQAMETAKTDEWCRCEWLIHPDDEKVNRGRCRQCGEKQDTEVHHGLPEDIETGMSHRYQGIRMRKGDQAWDCPVHTREGFLLYFFEWVKTHNG